MFRKLLVILFVFSIPLVVSAEKDIDGSKDHPALSRYPASTIFAQVHSDFDSYELALAAPVRESDSWDRVKKRVLEGKLTRTEYKLPDSSSLLAAYRSYMDALAKGGFEVLFTCQKEACGSAKFWYRLHLDIPGDEDARQYYLSAKKASDTGAIYIAIHFSQVGENVGYKYAQVDVIEEKALARDLIKTSVEGLGGAFSSTGKALIYDIYFDTGKAEIKSESQLALNAITLYLKKNSQKVYVVGHTDDVGVLASNMELSKRRAESIVNALVKAGIGKERLLPQGVGPLAPVASNDQESGREKNRRVELVLMFKQ